MPRLALFFASAVLIAACSGGATPAPTASPVPSDAPAGELTLNRAPANLGCDAMAPGYASVTFHIDSSAADPVTATTDGGATLETYWSDGFTGDADMAVVLGPDGQEVAADGDVLQMPEADWPRLGGYFVCPSTDAVYVLEIDPE